MFIFNIFDNIYDNNFYVLEKDGILYLLHNEVKDVVYLSNDKDEFSAIFQYVDDNPITASIYPDLMAKFVHLENFYINKKGKLGCFEYPTYKRLPIEKKGSFEVENFLFLINERLMNKPKKIKLEINISEDDWNDLIH